MVKVLVGYEQFISTDGTKTLWLPVYKEVAETKSDDDSNALAHCCAIVILAAVGVLVFTLLFPLALLCCITLGPFLIPISVFCCRPISILKTDFDDYDYKEMPQNWHSLTSCWCCLVICPLLLLLFLILCVAVIVNFVFVPGSIVIVAPIVGILMLYAVFIYFLNCGSCGFLLCCDTCCFSPLYRFTGTNLSLQQLKRKLENEANTEIDLKESEKLYTVYTVNKKRKYIVTNMANERQTKWFKIMDLIYKGYMWTTCVTCGLVTCLSCGLTLPFWCCMQCVPLCHERCCRTKRNPCVDYLTFTALLFGCAPCWVWALHKKNGSELTVENVFLNFIREGEGSNERELKPVPDSK